MAPGRYWVRDHRIGHAVCISVCVRVTFGHIRAAKSRGPNTIICAHKEGNPTCQHPAPILPLPVIVVVLWQFSVIMIVRLIPSIMQHFQFTLLLELVILHTGVNEFNCQLRRVNTSIRILLLEFPCIFFRQLPQFGMHALLYGRCSLVCIKSGASTCYFFTFTKNCNAEELDNKFPWMEQELFYRTQTKTTHLATYIMISVSMVYISDLLGICTAAMHVNTLFGVLS